MENTKLKYKNYKITVDSDSVCGEVDSYIAWLIENGADAIEGISNSGTDCDRNDLSSDELNAIWEDYCNG